MSFLLHDQEEHMCRVDEYVCVQTHSTILFYCANAMEKGYVRRKKKKRTRKEHRCNTNEKEITRNLFFKEKKNRKRLKFI